MDRTDVCAGWSVAKVDKFGAKYNYMSFQICYRILFEVTVATQRATQSIE